MSNTELQSNLPWQVVYDELGVTEPVYEDTPLGKYVEDHASRMPEAPALQYYDQTLNYAELNQEAAKLANALQKLGVEQGDVIGCHMPNMPQYIIGLVAASKLGCVGSGVSPLMTPSELYYQLEDAGISVVISLDALVDGVVSKMTSKPARLKYVISAGAADYLNPADADVQPLQGEPLIGAISHSYLSLIAGAEKQFEQTKLMGDSTMMVQYTGGTTGRPKGAELSISCLMNNPMQCAVYMPWKEGEIVHTPFPLFHAAGLAFALSSLRYGGLFVLIPDPRDLDFICTQLKRFPPTRLGAVPSMFQMLLGHPEFSKVDFSQLQIANTGAAPMSENERTLIEEVIGDGKLSDMFGMTETGPAHICNPPGRCKPGSVGIPVMSAESRIVDLETGTQEMPVGESGEIVTTGPQLMKGYLNLPEETEKAIRQWRGKRWMYTGDVGYADEEGYIYLCDRAKDMLIVGGYKVFSVELEEKLQSFPDLVMSAVVGQADEKRPGNDIVNLFVELSPEAAALLTSDSEVTEKRNEILDFCREYMAPYKVPKKVHFIDAIPLTAVGKIDKKVLRASLAS